MGMKTPDLKKQHLLNRANIRVLTLSPHEVVFQMH